MVLERRGQRLGRIRGAIGFQLDLGFDQRGKDWGALLVGARQLERRIRTLHLGVDIGEELQQVEISGASETACCRVSIAPGLSPARYSYLA